MTVIKDPRHRAVSGSERVLMTGLPGALAIHQRVENQLEVLIALPAILRAHAEQDEAALIVGSGRAKTRSLACAAPCRDRD